MNFIRTMITAPEDLLNEYFDTELIKAPLARLASEIGAPPSQKGITAGLMMLAMRNYPGMARPKGVTGSIVPYLKHRVSPLTNKYKERSGISKRKSLMKTRYGFFLVL